MSRPAATATLQILRYLSRQLLPVPAARIARDLNLPRSSTYHLLTTMEMESFVVHFPEDRTWGIGIAAWEIGQGFSRQEPLARLARLPLAQLVDRLGQSAHLAVLHGSDVLYICEERARRQPPLVTDVGVRLPAHLTASGRAILASLPPAQVSALFSRDTPLVTRTEIGPTNLNELRRILIETRRRGYAWEDGEITPGFASIAVAINAPTQIASIAVTWPTSASLDFTNIIEAAHTTATILAARLGVKSSPRG